MKLINISHPPSYTNNSSNSVEPSSEFYLLLLIVSMLFLCFTRIVCSKYIENNCKNSVNENNIVRSRETTININDINDKICNNFDSYELENSNLSDDEHLPSYSEAVRY